jgi:hypothetical protein
MGLEADQLLALQSTVKYLSQKGFDLDALYFGARSIGVIRGPRLHSGMVFACH